MPESKRACGKRSDSISCLESDYEHFQADLIPLTAEAIAAISRALSNHKYTQRLRLKMTPAAALLADIILAKRADSKAQRVDK